jgi:hypothetical protein
MITEDLVVPTKTLYELLPNDDLKSFPMLLIEKAYLTIYNNRGCYKNLATHFGRMQLAEMISTTIYPNNMEMLADWDIDPAEMEFDAHFDSASFAMSVIWWIDRDVDITHKQMAKFLKKRLRTHWIDRDDGRRDWNHSL